MRVRLSLTLATALAMALAGCGGDPEPEATTPAAAADGELRLVGNDSVRWANDAPTAVAVDGALDITLVCEGAVPHDLAIEGVQDGESLVICNGTDEATTTVEIDPGAYVFFCTVTGHRASGMEGVLTVS